MDLEAQFADCLTRCVDAIAVYKALDMLGIFCKQLPPISISQIRDPFHTATSYIVPVTVCIFRAHNQPISPADYINNQSERNVCNETIIE